MALNFHKLDNLEHVFGLDDKQFEELSGIFLEFKYRTGYTISQYDDFKLIAENQIAMIRIIDAYLYKSDLNKNISKTVTIIEFRTLLKYFSGNKVDILIKGD